MKMTARQNSQIETSRYAAALARWDDEAGAPPPLASEAVPETWEGGRSSPGIAELPSADATPFEEEHILECLGAAVIMRWGTLPTKIQRELFESATTLADLKQTDHVKGEIARFLHNHKNDGTLGPRPPVL